MTRRYDKLGAKQLVRKTRVGPSASHKLALGTTTSLTALASFSGAALADDGPLWTPSVGGSASFSKNDTLGSLDLFMPIAQDEDSVFYLDLRVQPGDISDLSGSYGIGAQQIINPDLMIGGYAYFNNERIGNVEYQGVTLGGQIVTSSLDVSANIYLPTSSDVQTGGAAGGGVGLSIVGNTLIAQTGAKFRRQLRGVDVEAGYRLRDIFGNGKSLRFSAGGFYYQSQSNTNIELTGARAGVEFEFKTREGAYAPRFSVGGTVSHDNQNQTQWAGHVRFVMPLGRDNSVQEYGQQLDGDNNLGAPVSEGLRDRLQANTLRPTGVISIEDNQSFVPTTTVVDPNTGAAFGKFAFADDANTAGAGTFRDPDTLDGAVATAGGNGYLVALENGLAGNINANNVQLQDGQTLIGGGTPITVLVNGVAQQFVIPGAAGTISGTNAAGSAILLGNNNRIQNVTITGAGTGIMGTGVSNASFTDVRVQNTGGAGINLINATGTFEFKNTDIANTAGPAFQANGGSAAFNFDADSSISQGVNAAAMNIMGGHSGAVNFAGTANATAGSGLQFNNADGTYNLSGAVALNGGDAGIDILNGSAGTFTFDNTTITNPTGVAFNLQASTGTVNFNAGSSIAQSNAASAVKIDQQSGGVTNFLGAITASTSAANSIDLTNNAGGQINFAGPLGLTSGAGTTFSAIGGGIFSATNAANSLNATAGQALNIDGMTIGAAGASFNSIMSAGSANQGVRLNNMTGGAFTATTTTITNSGDDGVKIDGVANAATFGTINITNAGDEGFDVDNSPGNITVGGLTITGAVQDGLDLTNATGALSFTGVSVSGTGSNGIDLNGPLGALTFTGLTTISNAGSDGLDMDFVTGGPVTFNGLTITNAGDDGITMTSSASGATFNGVTTVSGSGGEGIGLRNANGNVTFASIDIDNSTGRGFEILNATNNVTVNGGSIDDGAAGGFGVTIQGQTAPSTIEFNNLAINHDQGGADTLNVQNSAGTIRFLGGSMTNSTSNDLVDVDGGSAVITVSSTLTNVGATLSNGVEVSSTTGGSVTISGNYTATGVLNGVDLDNNAGAVNFNGTVSITNASAQGIQVTNSSGAVNFTAMTTINNAGPGVGVDLSGNVGGTTTFSGGLNIDTSTGIGLQAAGGGTLNIAATAGDESVTTTNGQAVSLNSVAIGTGLHLDSIASTNSTGNGVQFSSLSGGAINVDTVDINSAGGDGLSVSSLANTTTIGQLDVDGATNDGLDITAATNITIGTVASGLNIDGAAQSGIRIAGANGTINLGTTAGSGGVDIGTTTVVGDSGILLSSDTSGNINIGNAADMSSIHAGGTGNAARGIWSDAADATVLVTSVDINQSGSGATGHGIFVSDNDTTGTFTLTGTNTIDNTGGDGINISNATAAISNLTLGAAATGAANDISGDGIAVINNDANTRTVTLNNITMGSASGDTGDIAGRGVFLSSTGTGALTANFTGTNVIRSTNAAIDADATNTNTLVTALDNITAERGTAGFTIDVQGASHTATTSPIVVTSLNSLTVDANGTNGGALFNQVEFDADGVSGGPNVQVSATGTIQIGQGPAAADRVQGDGLSLLSTGGDLNIATLNVFNNAGTGLEVDTKSAAPSTTFNLAVGGGTINTSGGPALFLDPLTGGINLNSVTSSGSSSGGATSSGASGNGTGITVDGFIGTMNIGTTTLTNLGANETGINFTNNNAGTNVNFGTTTITSSNAGVTGIDLQNTNGETITIGSGSSINLTGAGSVGLDLSNAGANTNFTFGDGTAPPSSTINADRIIDLTGYTGGGTINLLDVDLSNVNLGPSFGNNTTHFFSQTGAGTMDGSSAANASTVATADAVTTANMTFVAVGGGVIDVNVNGDGSFNLGADQDLVSFDSVGGTVSAGFSNPFGANILLNSTAGTITDVGNTGKTGLSTSAAGGADFVVQLGHNSMLSNIEIDNSDGGAEIAIAGTGGLGSAALMNVDISGTGFGINLQSAGGNLTVDSASSITNTILSSYTENLGTANVTFHGAITETDGVGSAINMFANTAGTTTFNGAINANTGSSHAVSFSGTGSTLSINGGLNIDTTTGSGILATVGGTLNCSGSAPNGQICLIG